MSTATTDDSSIVQLEDEPIEMEDVLEFSHTAEAPTVSSIPQAPMKYAKALYSNFKLILGAEGTWIRQEKGVDSKLKQKVDQAVRTVASSSVVRRGRAAIRNVMNKLPSHYTNAYLFLLVLGFMTAIVGVTIDLLIVQLDNLHEMIVEREHISSIALQYFIWIGYSLAFISIAIFLTKKIAPTAAGSGLPELKAILSGVYLSEYLSFKTLIAKVLGIIFAVGSGVYLGKEGPLVHSSSILANQLSRFTIFERIRKNPTLMQQVLSASCAAGIAANLGTPIGGVLFSIEVTSTYYPVRNYWYSFITSITGAIIFRWLWNLALGRPPLTSIAPTHFTSLNFSFADLFVFCMLGAVCAILGVLFIKFHIGMKKLWLKISKGRPYISSPYAYALIIAFVTSTLTFPHFIGHYLQLDSLKALQDLVTESAMDSPALAAEDWTKGSLRGNLILFFILRYLLTAVSISMSLPAGLLIPLFSAGGALGRLFGEILQSALANDPTYIIVPGGYAVVGAAALVGSITHSVSISVVMYEMTGQLHYLLPILLSVFVSVGLSKKLSSLSIYEAVSKDRGLPFMPDLPHDQYISRAKDIMDDKVACISQDFPVNEVTSALENHDYREFPVVESRDTMVLVGQVDRGDLEEAIQRQSEQPSQHLSDIVVRDIPIQISENTPLSHVHMLFINLRMFHAFIANHGRLTGVVSRKKLQETIEGKRRAKTLMKE